MTAKRILSAIPLIILAFLIQSSVLRGMAFWGTVPNLLLIVCCSYGYLRGERSGMWAGFFCGLLLDIFLMETLGVYALLFLYLGYLSGLTHPLFEPMEFRIPFLLFLCGDILHQLLLFLFFHVLNGDFAFQSYLYRQLLPELAGTLMSAVFLYPLLLWIEVRLINRDPAEKKKNNWNVNELAEAERKDGVE